MSQIKLLQAKHRPTISTFILQHKGHAHSNPARPPSLSSPPASTPQISVVATLQAAPHPQVPVHSTSVPLHILLHLCVMPVSLGVRPSTTQGRLLVARRTWFWCLQMKWSCFTWWTVQSLLTGYDYWQPTPLMKSGDGNLGNLKKTIEFICSFM